MIVITGHVSNICAEVHKNGNCKVRSVLKYHGRCDRAAPGAVGRAKGAVRVLKC